MNIYKQIIVFNSRGNIHWLVQVLLMCIVAYSVMSGQYVLFAVISLPSKYNTVHFLQLYLQTIFVIDIVVRLLLQHVKGFDLKPYLILNVPKRKLAVIAMVLSFINVNNVITVSLVMGVGIFAKALLPLDRWFFFIGCFSIVAIINSIIVLQKLFYPSLLHALLLVGGWAAGFYGMYLIDVDYTKHSALYSMALCGICALLIGILFKKIKTSLYIE